MIVNPRPVRIIHVTMSQKTFVTFVVGTIEKFKCTDIPTKTISGI